MCDQMFEAIAGPEEVIDIMAAGIKVPIYFA